jgi:hypothetical protein
MHINFIGKISAFSANLVQGAGNLTVSCKMDEIDDDTIDRLSELCSMEVGASARLEANNKKPVTFPSCWISGVKGDYASKIVKITLRFPKSELLNADEAVLVEVCRMDWDVSVEISNRQMTLSEAMITAKLERS